MGLKNISLLLLPHVCATLFLFLYFLRNMKEEERMFYRICSGEPPDVALVMAQAASLRVLNSALPRMSISTGKMLASITHWRKHKNYYNLFLLSTKNIKETNTFPYIYVTINYHVEICFILLFRVDLTACFSLHHYPGTKDNVSLSLI